MKLYNYQKINYLHKTFLGLALLMLPVIPMIAQNSEATSRAEKSEKVFGRTPQSGKVSEVLVYNGGRYGWELGAGPGLVTPLKNVSFFGSMRPTFGLFIHKDLTPAFGLGVESVFGFNTSTMVSERQIHSKTAIDHSYLGVFVTTDLISAFQGYPGNKPRKFGFGPTLGIGWLHDFSDHNRTYDALGAKFGINLKFSLCENLSLSLRPSIFWQLTRSKNTNVSFDVNRSVFSFSAGLGYRFGMPFRFMRPYNPGEIDFLNGQINDLRTELATEKSRTETWKLKAQDLEDKLDAANRRQPQVQVVKEVRDNLNTTRYIFFGKGSSRVSADQQPNVEMIASYMNNHPGSTVSIKGYASPEGNAEANQKLARQRAEAVKDALVKRYKIAASRISAEGEGVGQMFDEPGWNRVSIATITVTK